MCFCFRKLMKRRGNTDEKGKYNQFLYAISILLIIGFAIRIGVDYYNYNTIHNSGPFYVFVIERMIEFMIPSIIFFVVAKITKKKYTK